MRRSRIQPRVRRVVEMAVERPEVAPDVSRKDIRDVEDLVLVTRSGNRFVVANPIYRELYEAGAGTVNGTGSVIMSM